MNRTLRGIVLGIALTLAATHAAGAEPGLQQYTSGGHAMGFRPDGYFVSNGTFALRVAFENAQPVEPASGDTAAETAPDTKAPALSRVTYSGLWKGIRRR